MSIILRALATLALLLSAPGAHAQQPQVGELAPDFTLTLLDGSRVSLSDLRGQVVVLNFWATWCGPCRAELPLLDTYYSIDKKFGLSVYAIEDQDEASVPMVRLKQFLGRLTIPSARHISGPYRTLGGVPTNYIIGRDGRVRYARAAAFDLDSLNGLLVPLLKEPPPAPAPIVATIAR